MGLLDECPVLKEIYETGNSYSLSGEVVRTHSFIRREYSDALYRTVLSNGPSVALEIGMAFGVSTLAILTALHKIQGSGKLISLDPFQSSFWKGCGSTSVQRAGFQDHHELIEEFDYLALPRLLHEGQRIGFAYIDGNHTFDYTLLDFWYVDKMLAVGGVVGFNDCDYPAVNKVIKFILSHRKYAEIDVGLAFVFVDYTRFRGLVRRVTGQLPQNYYKLGQDRYFKKIENLEPRWDYFAEF